MQGSAAAETRSAVPPTGAILMAQNLTDLDPDLLLAALRSRGGDTKSRALAAAAAAPPEVVEASDDELATALRTVQKAIYGTDDRQDVYQVSDAALLADADSSVAVIPSTSLTDNGDGTSTLTGPTLGAAFNLCPTEPFRDQPSIADCSGFLAGPDVVVTAGHCIVPASFSDVRIVFGYQMLNATTAATRIAGTEIYRVSAVLGHSLGAGGNDWAVVRLDRTVPNHSPLPVRTSGKIPDGETVHVIGHPSGLPKKIAGNARVRDNTPSGHFVANLDTYGGNSGSPVFSSATHQVEGVLVSGETDYVLVGGCVRSNVCPDSGCSGENVTRSTQFAHLLSGGGSTTTPPPWPGRFFRFPPLTRGEDVRQWQTRMSTIGHSLVADGLYGQLSKAACTALQRDRGIQVDGVVGPDTWRETFR
ncbi:trypsin-like peptidase domain-containing protein [Actinotalea sp. K2]|uniref:trypsin-like peptidase domain-containing protein n=1 Tax=Actinotalea sp. K2 TaxID=2939438 RepID=UPI0020178003|nr:trypsin-like peptidase domain-containing protein [Actinotalea sp. K2]MCL3860432.1 trypsin-like peptidase domain-containing protein [Actinotalea sp. K2]